MPTSNAYDNSRTRLQLVPFLVNEERNRRQLFAPANSESQVPARQRGTEQAAAVSRYFAIAKDLPTNIFTFGEKL